MKKTHTHYRIAASTLLITLLLISNSSAQQTGIVYDEEVSLKGLSAINSDITVKAWLGAPRNNTSFNHPTITWFSTKKDATLYALHVLGLYEYQDTGDGVFQSSETVKSFSFLTSTTWSFGSWQTGGNGQFADLPITLNATNPASTQFNYLTGKLHLLLRIYNNTATRMIGPVSVSSTSTEAQLLVGLDEWRWSGDTTSLALFFDVYAVNNTEIRAKSLSETDFILGSVPWESPESLKATMRFFAPAGFLLANLNVTTPDGNPALLDVSKNETVSNLGRRIDFPTSANQSDPFEPRRIGFVAPSRALPGYLSVSDGTLVAPENKVEKANISYVAAGNFVRMFVSYPRFSNGAVFYLFRLGINQSLLSEEPSPTPTPPPTSPSPSATPPTLSGLRILGIEATFFVAALAITAFGGSLLAARRLRKGIPRA